MNLPESLQSKREWAARPRGCRSETDPKVAVMVALPIPLPVASPALEIVAMAGGDEVQLAELVKSCVLPSE